MDLKEIKNNCFTIIAISIALILLLGIFIEKEYNKNSNITEVIDTLSAMKVEPAESSINESSNVSYISIEEIKNNLQLYAGHRNQFEVISEPIEIIEDVISREPLSISHNEGFIYYKSYYDYKYNCYVNIPMSEQWQKYTYEKCLKYDIPYELALAVMGIETGFDIFIGIRTDSRGNEYYGPGMVSVSSAEVGLKKHGIELCTYEGGVEAVCFIIKEKLDEFYWDTHKALIAYNCGRAGANKKISEGISSTNYSDRVMEIMEGLKIYKEGLSN